MAIRTKPKRRSLSFLPLALLVLGGWMLQVNNIGQTLSLFHEYTIVFEATRTPSTAIHSTRKSNLPLLPPQIVLRDYIKWHSHEGLLRDPNNRTFVLGLYSCPHQAGNRLHDFFGAFQAAMVLNATFLWKYYDQDTCTILRRNGGASYNSISKWCLPLLGNETVCAKAVTRASWIPSYDEWASKFRLPSLFEMKRGYRSSNNTIFVPKEVPFPTDKRGFNNKFLMTPVNPSSAIVKRTKDLFSEGSPFLNGMLFEELVPIRADLYTPPPVSSHKNDNVISIALHSRHVSETNSGGDVTNETKCLDDVLSSIQQTEQSITKNPVSSCVVYIMSDREATVQNLTAFLETERNCTVVVQTNKTQSKGLSLEHGMHAGLGYFQELAMARHARHGVVSTESRSSSQLLHALIAYSRHTDVETFPYHKNNNETTTLAPSNTTNMMRDAVTGRLQHELATCLLPKGKIWG